MFSSEKTGLRKPKEVSCSAKCLQAQDIISFHYFRGEIRQYGRGQQANDVDKGVSPS